jgi:hypothetical protein
MHGPVPETERLADSGQDDTPPAKAAPPPAGRAWRRAGTAVFLLSLVALFTAYLRLSSTYPENSDEANILLMASDMAHGNLDLSGWNVSDVPFITTELPEIAVLVRLFGLHLNTAHIAAALTYTVVVATAMLLSSGGTTPHSACPGGRPPQTPPRPRCAPDGKNRHHIGRADGGRSRFPLVRMAIALAIMLAPQPGVGVFVMVFSVGHIGTAAPVMLTWLVLDRFPRRWYVPVIVGVLLAWTLMADPLVLVIAIIPVLVVATVRLAPGPAGRGIQNGSLLRHLRHAFTDRWLESSLVAAAGIAYLAAWCGGRLLHAVGGYTQQPVPFTLDPVSTWWAHSRIVAHGLLTMFGAFFLPGNAVNYLGPGNYVAAPPLSGLAEAVAITRLACVALSVWGACAVARRFFRQDADLVSQLLLVGLVANLAAYIPSSLADHTALNAREFAPVIPFAAVLAARMLGDRLGDRVMGSHLRLGRTSAVERLVRGRRGDRVVAAGLCALVCWYGFGLAEETRIPAAPDPFARLEAFLTEHHLTEGIGGYWNSSVITVDTGGAITIRAVTQGCLQPYDWESKPAWYDPASRTAGFVLESTGPGYFSQWQASPAALRQLDTLLPAAKPATLNPGGGYVVHAYQGNLLTRLPLLAHC